MRPKRRPSDCPVLRFSPTAWAKLQYFCHRGNTEIGGFGLTSAEDLLLVEDFVTVRQSASGVSVSFDDAAVADFFETQVDCGRRPEQFARLWCHTHPGNSPIPSLVDEETFHRVFGSCDWAIMFIVARGGKTYARLRFNVGPGGQILIPVAVDYRLPFPAADHAAWEAEYQAHIQTEPTGWDSVLIEHDKTKKDQQIRSAPDDWLEELEGMEPEERRLVLDELAARPELWGEESEVLYG
jgi:proteasome lid subunit RPN8/RPN11